MKEPMYQEVLLAAITSNPNNPRRNFSGIKFDELCKSIQEKGVIEPIILRNKPGGTYEIVAGERRFRALSRIAEQNGGIDNTAIPAMIRYLTDEQTFDIMTIENLQREDLTELEEALSFKAYFDRKGKDSIQDLAGRTGINPSYIHRRIHVLDLPKYVLNAWGKGKIKYGHCEQLARLKEKKEILDIFREILDYNVSVKRLKNEIDNKAPELRYAKFDLEKTGCLTCMQNTDVQKSIFGADLSNLIKTHCLNPKCFKQKQNNWLQANWNKTDYKKRHGTNGFRFQEDVSWNQYSTFYKYMKRGKKCKECPHFVTLINTNGTVYSDQVCIGDKGCFNQQTITKTTGTSKSSNNKKSWHGEYFREQFYTEQIPLKLADTKPDDQKIHRLSLLSLLYSNRDIGSWFADSYMGKKKNSYDSYHYSSLDEKWRYIESLSNDEVQAIIKEAAIQITLQYGFGPKTRHVIGSYLGFDLKRDWQLNEEYLNKKTIKEILAMGEKYNIFNDKKAQDFLYEVLLKKRGKFANCKKKELVRVFLESGIDLAGKVPQEILEVDKK